MNQRNGRVHLRNGRCISLPLRQPRTNYGAVPTDRFIPLHVLSRLTGLPVSWLRAEADAGRIPCLRAGRRRMFNIGLVMSALSERSLTPCLEACGTKHVDHEGNRDRAPLAADEFLERDLNETGL